MPVPPRGCHKAEVWLAELAAGRLDGADRERLRDHLSSCPECRRRVRGISRLVDLLREEQHDVPAAGMERLWKAVEPEAGRAGGWLSTGRHWRRRWVVPATAAAFLAGAAAAALLVLVPQRRDLPAGDVAPVGRAPASTTQARQWRVLAASGLATDGRIRHAGDGLSGGSLSVTAAGRAVLYSSREIVVIEGRTVATLEQRAERPVLVLTRGSATVATRRLVGGGSVRPELEVWAGAWRVQPVGTAFTVHAETQPRVAVALGRVQVTDHAQRVELGSGAMLRRGDSVGELPDEARDAIARLTRVALRLARQAERRRTATLKVSSTAEQPIHVDGLGVGSGETTILLSAGEHELGLGTPDGLRLAQARQRVWISPETERSPSIQLDEPPRIAPEPSAQPRADASAAASRNTLRSIERLIASGETARAREQLRRLIRDPRQQGTRAALRTMVAESYVREERYSQAVATYHLVERNHPHDVLGAHALFMVASLQLDQLSQPRRGLQAISRYLKRYPRGQQRQEAQLFRCRALERLGELERARDAAREYLRDHPKGLYRAEVKRITGLP